MNYRLEIEPEADGRWLTEVPELAVVLAYGASSDEGMAKAEALALRVLAEQLEHGEAKALNISFYLSAATRPTGRRPRPGAYLRQFSRWHLEQSSRPILNRHYSTIHFRSP